MTRGAGEVKRGLTPIQTPIIVKVTDVCVLINFDSSKLVNEINFSFSIYAEITTEPIKNFREFWIAWIGFVFKRIC